MLSETQFAAVNAEFGSSQITLKENLTAQRRILLNEAINAKKFLNFKFLWTSQGQIRLKKDTGSRIFNIKSVSDLYNLGYTNPGRSKRSLN